jgi:glycosyltransferase involved in cell wall biosynthesis
MRLEPHPIVSPDDEPIDSVGSQPSSHDGGTESQPMAVWNQTDSEVKLLARIEQLRAEIGRLTAELDRRDRRLAALAEWAEGQSALVSSITSGRAWALAQVIGRVRRALAPPGSVRARLGRAALRIAAATGRSGRSLKAALSRLAAPSTHHATMRTTEGTSSMGVPGLVTVVLPVYNQADLLTASIESVLAQSYSAFELIIVNDGSTDGVEDVLARFVTHPKVRILTKANQGLSRALSHGFSFASGEFWTWTSADNLMHPSQLTREVEFLRANPDVAMVYADYIAIDDRGEPLRDPEFRRPNRRPPDSPHIRLPRSTEQLNTVKDNFIGPCFLYRGWVGRFVGEYDPDRPGTEDYDYWMRMNRLFRIAHLGTDEALYQYRVHDNSLSGRAGELRIAEHCNRLMSFELERAADFAKPWTIHVDRRVVSHLDANRRGPDNSVVVRANPAAGSAGDAPHARHTAGALRLIDASTLPELEALPARSDCSVAVWYSGPDAAHDHGALAARRGWVGFAPDEATAARLSLLGIQAFVVAGGGPVVSAALKHARHHSFYELTRREVPGHISPPDVFQPAGKPLHVLIQVDNFTEGGLENVVLGLATGLDPKRFRVSLLVLGRSGHAVARAKAWGVQVLALPELNREEHYRRLLVSEAVDLVNAHYSLFGAQTAADLGLPFVQVIHNSYVWLVPEEIAAHKAADAHTTAYICVSASAARYCDAKLGLPVAKMIIVPNGVDTAALEQARSTARGPELRRDLGLAPDHFVFLNVGQICPTKAQVEIVRALAKVIRSQPRARLVLAGRCHEPPYADRLEREIARHGLESAVVNPGRREDVARFYWMADAFVLPSLWEGWSLALGEAAYAGLPIVATDVGGARDVLCRTAGQLISPPFRPVDVDSTNLKRVMATDHARFVDDLAEAMSATCHATRTTAGPSLRGFLDRTRVHRAYANIFSWLAQGGPPDAARAWSDPQNSDQTLQVLATAAPASAA